MKFCSWCVHKKVHILLPLACDLNLVITSEASRVVNSCSFTGIILFPYFNSTKELKKTTASGNSRIRSSISPIRLDCSIRVYLNFALRKQEKLNNLLPQFFCVYTNRHLIDTYSSFCVIAGGEIFSHSHVLLVSFSFFCSSQSLKLPAILSHSFLIFLKRWKKITPSLDATREVKDKRNK